MEQRRRRVPDTAEAESLGPTLLSHTAALSLAFPAISARIGEAFAIWRRVLLPAEDPGDGHLARNHRSYSRVGPGIANPSGGWCLLAVRRYALATTQCSLCVNTRPIARGNGNDEVDSTLKPTLRASRSKSATS